MQSIVQYTTKIQKLCFQNTRHYIMELRNGKIVHFIDMSRPRRPPKPLPVIKYFRLDENIGGRENQIWKYLFFSLLLVVAVNYFYFIFFSEQPDI